MSDLADPRICPKCGSPLPEGVLEGLCTRCLFEAGLAEASETEATDTRPSLENSSDIPDLGNYHRLELLGEGGMGVVYLAEQRAPIRRRVALKVLKYGDAGSSVSARFEAETQALALMDHANIAQVYDAGVTPDGRPYFAMEYVPGVPITDYCDRNMLGIRERLMLFQQVCLAVQHAHQKGIIHRDLKPSNILVMVQDSHPVTKIIDFGVAKAVNQRLIERTLFTEAGAFIGTPEYMSPEQADHTGLDLDRTTDIYSLGVILYELLVGALPFDPKTLRRLGYAEIQRVIHEEEPPRPSTRLSTLGEKAEEVARCRRSDVRSLTRLLRGDLEWITMKALEKDRTRRYATASDFAADIGRHLANEPVLARRSSIFRRGRKFVRRHRGMLAAATVIVIALLTGVGITWFAPHDAARSPDLKPVRLTSNSGVSMLNAVISPDGRNVAYSDPSGIRIRSVQTGETRLLPNTRGYWVTSWFPDGNRMAAVPLIEGRMRGICIISTHGAEARKLHDIGPTDGNGRAFVSPDGSQIAYVGVKPDESHELWVIGAGGEHPHVLRSWSVDHAVSLPTWSQNAGRIAFVDFQRLGGQPHYNIEAIKLIGGQVTTLLKDWRSRIEGLVWLRDGRMLFASEEPAPRQGEWNLWQIRTNIQTGQVAGTAQRLTNWPAISIGGLTVSADGKRLAFIRTLSQTNVSIGELEAAGTRMKQPRRLSLHESNNYPYDWMPDSRTVLFASDRGGVFRIFKQAIDADSAEALVSGKDNAWGPTVTYDGKWILYISYPQAGLAFGSLPMTASMAPSPRRLMRMPISGGSPQSIFESPNDLDINCTRSPANFCVCGELVRKQWVVSLFDPIHGKGPELFRVPAGPIDPMPSPDGSQFAYIMPGGKVNRIRFLASSGRPIRDIVLDAWPGLYVSYWAANNKGLYVGVISQEAGGTLLYVDLEGKAFPLWHQEGKIWGVPSPDGRYLAVLTETTDSNIWMLEGF